MKQLSLDDIVFVKSKIQMFINLPTSPVLNRDISPRHQVNRYQSDKRFSSKSTKKNQKQNEQKKAWLARKQHQILQLVNRSNKQKNTSLLDYLTSDKVNLKKRQSQKYQNYENIQKINEIQQQLNEEGFQLEQKSNQQVKQNLKQFASTKINLLRDQKQKQYFKNIDTNGNIVKPSMIKQNKANFFQFNDLEDHKKMYNKGQNKVNSNSKKFLKTQSHIDEKNEQQNELCLKTAKKSSSYSKFKGKEDLNKQKSKFSSKKMKNSSSQNYNESQDETDSINMIGTYSKQNQSKKVKFQNNSSLISCPSNSKSNSKFEKTFNNPYSLSRQTKYLINKYASKQISPDQKHLLKKKYQNLDKRLNNLLSSVKQQKKDAKNQQQSKFDSFNPNSQFSKKKFPEQLILYEKLSPLKKLMKINKKLKMKHQNQHQT